MMPQWDFLDFLRDEAKAFPGFQLEMESPVDSFIEDKGRVTGVRLAGGKELRAPLTIAADGRASIVRSTHAAGRGSGRADGRLLVPRAQAEARPAACAAMSSAGGCW